MLFTLMLGGMVGVVYRNGGMHGIIKHLIQKANTRKKGQVSVWLFGLIIFFEYEIFKILHNLLATFFGFITKSSNCTKKIFFGYFFFKIK